LSTQFGQGIKVEIFYPREKMPPISGPGDVVLIRNIKACEVHYNHTFVTNTSQAQIWKGCLSLLTNWSTVLNVFTATQIPLWPLLSSNDLAPAIATTTPYPSLAEANYIAWLHHHMDKSDIPNDEEFKQNMTRAMNVRDKYSLFKDLKCDHFYDLIGEVIRLYDSDGRISLYLSDYTPHSLFFNHAWGDTGDDGTGRDGDEYGYTKSRTKKAAEWPGPFGKMTLQLTVWDPHAAYIREQVKVGDWLLLRNVQSRMARMGGCLEGFLREDQKSYEGKIQVQILRQSTNPDENDSRWKDAVRRKQQWWAKFKEEKKNFLEEVTEEAHDKRNRDENEGSSKSNGKKRRKEKRAAAEVKVIAIEQKLLDKLDLNENSMY
jgi:protection-of-telomeres protein 1